MAVYDSEITSADEISDNPIHHRLFFGYFKSQEYISGDVLEVGCGIGRGVEILMQNSSSYTTIDKNEKLIAEHSKKYPEAKFIYENVPPFSKVESNSLDCVVTFHVIEHIKDHVKFVEEIHRVLKPGGIALISTPNKNMRLARNPWHVREYTPQELETLLKKSFDKVDKKGIAGNEKAMAYFEENRKSVRKYTRWDPLNIQYLIPAPLLRVPYDMLNRKNRKNLYSANEQLTTDITYEDYFLSDNPEKALDLFFVATK